MKRPMVWVFLMLSVFVMIFFAGSGAFQGMESSAFQVIGFAGMMFSLLYGLLLTENESEKERETQEYY
ncbi:hypothetical protein D7Z54_26395 [Salibacterium salarium]|uniref:Uncharacterized protein n=1 Tax=Salibacterium salarium TaxID=284579 RepID=A0A428MW71_9BACI|nr:hypothetical protein [Salibacterium salarium]RSL30372.1 hypothetical protein D7Z54_26395 [Salibacterium salarium]